MKCFAAILATCLAFAVPQAARAQEGYPLDGTWRGTWGQPGEEGTLAVVVMNWDGSINGRINPGRSTILFDSASLDASTWTVRIEATSREGEPILIVGQLEDLGSYNRRIVGTWTQAGVEHALELARE